jgi:hypothetical protein
MRDRVTAVSTIGKLLKLETAQSGPVDYGAVKAFN